MKRREGYRRGAVRKQLSTEKKEEKEGRAECRLRYIRPPWLPKQNNKVIRSNMNRRQGG